MKTCTTIVLHHAWHHALHPCLHHAQHHAQHHALHLAHLPCTTLALHHAPHHTRPIPHWPTYTTPALHSPCTTLAVHLAPHPCTTPDSTVNRMLASWATLTSFRTHLRAWPPLSCRDAPAIEAVSGQLPCNYQGLTIELTTHTKHKHPALNIRSTVHDTCERQIRAWSSMPANHMLT